jgi:hypothetical protein
MASLPVRNQRHRDRGVPSGRCRRNYLRHLMSCLSSLDAGRASNIPSQPRGRSTWTSAWRRPRPKPASWSKDWSICASGGLRASSITRPDIDDVFWAHGDSPCRRLIATPFHGQVVGLPGWRPAVPNRSGCPRGVHWFAGASKGAKAMGRESFGCLAPNVNRLRVWIASSPIRMPMSFVPTESWPSGTGVWLTPTASTMRPPRSTCAQLR